MTSKATPDNIEHRSGTQARAAPPSRIGLVLSGGGFRATLFHLGVIRFLRDQGLLSQVQHVCAVSGGSIMAAHLAANWRDYASTNPEIFDAAANKLIAFIRLNVRDLVLRRYLCQLLSYYWLSAGLIFWLLGIFVWISSFLRLFQSCPWAAPCIWAAVGLVMLFLGQVRRWGRVGLLQSYYHSKLYGGISMNKLGHATEQGISPPKVDLLTTSLTTGRICSFNRDGFVWTEFDQDQQKDVEHGVSNGLLPVALGVAASSAFPAAFPPVKVDRRILGMEKGSFASQYLTDGGVYDNLGVSRIESAAARDGSPFDYIFVSDAQGVFNREQTTRFWSLAERARRASDILMNRVSKLEYEGLIDEKANYVCCKLERVLERGGDGSLEHDKAYYEEVDPGLQRRLKAIRTDLNNFNDSEVFYLVGHGYAVARDAWMRTEHRDPLKDEAQRGPWRPKLATNHNPAELNLSEKRSFRNLWEWRDAVSWGNLLLLSVPVLLLGCYACFYFRPPRPVGLEYEVHLTQQKEVTGDRAWLNPILTSLIGGGTEGRQVRELRVDSFRILTLTTEPFGLRTRGLPASPFHIQIYSSNAACRIAGAYGFRASGTAGGMTYRPLAHSMVHRRDWRRVEQQEHALAQNEFPQEVMEFTVPESGPDDSLIFIVRLTNAGDKEFPAETETGTFKAFVNLEVRQ